MKNGKTPDPNVIHPITGYDREIYVKPTLQNPNILVGDFTYIADSDFESHVTHFYPWSRDKLIIGKFCQIAAGVEFVMNDANHQMSAVSTFPFSCAVVRQRDRADSFLLMVLPDNPWSSRNIRYFPMDS